MRIDLLLNYQARKPDLILHYVLNQHCFKWKSFPQAKRNENDLAHYYFLYNLLYLLPVDRNKDPYLHGQSNLQTGGTDLC